LWLHDIVHLNDPSELTYGCNPAIEFIAAKENNAQPEIKEFAVRLREMLQGEVAKQDLSRRGIIFVLSFSEAGNDLAQWRAYADNGRGYALGFDAYNLEEAFEKSTGGSMSFPVHYSKSELCQIQRQIIDEVPPLITIHGGKEMTPEAKKYSVKIDGLAGLAVLRVAIFFKHHAYCNEREYRFLEVCEEDAGPDIKNRARRYTLIRYKEFDWRSVVPDSLKKIVVGPASAEQQKKGVAVRT
jgi:hypothetical protein